MYILFDTMISLENAFSFDKAELFVNNNFIETAFIEQRSVRYRSPSQSYIQITTSTLEPRVNSLKKKLSSIEIIYGRYLRFFLRSTLS